MSDFGLHEHHSHSSAAALLIIFSELLLLSSFQLLLFYGLLTLSSHLLFLFCSFLLFIPSSSSANQSLSKKFQPKVCHEEVSNELQRAPPRFKDFITLKEPKLEEPPKLVELSDEGEEEREENPLMMRNTSNKAVVMNHDIDQKRTLALKLFEKKRCGVDGGSECVMDLLWEVSDVLEEEEREKKEAREAELVFYVNDNGDRAAGDKDDEEEDAAVQVCCLKRTFKCSSWKMNLRRKGRPSLLLKLSKTFIKRFEWLHP